ncbi:helix-turn-helix domain-containing protein [Enterococcus sp. DIV0187]|uniref:helix-turn-helix domain-containing protein n=1 Tax=Enterococcus sp. DIV0187 TaxID=2774644 RepID=UPI003F1FEAAB
MSKLEIILNDEQAKIIQQYLRGLISHEISQMRNNTTDNNQRYMNKKQTCDYLQISNNTLDRWIENGLPEIKINGVIRFDRLSIDKWLSDQV